MSELLIHPVTQQFLDGYQKAPTHALLLVGQAGIGKFSLAQRLAEETLGLKDKSFTDYAYGMHLRPEDGKSIGIESVRELEQFLSLKVPRSFKYNRGVIVENAGQLSPEAQNALLKTLEEPPEATIIILTATHEQSLLPTINSRVQTISVQRPEKQRVLAHFEQKFTDANLNQIYAVSSGLPGLMNSLLQEEDHPLAAATEAARKLLGLTTYERLLEVDLLAKDRQLSGDVMYILQQMAHVSLQTAQGASAKKWQSVLSASHDASEALRASAQTKLVLTNLMLQL
jgi:hypothetical protein